MPGQKHTWTGFFFGFALAGVMSQEILPEPLSLTRMASHLSVSRPTLERWCRDWPDMPILERGGPGHPHKFDPVAVTTFVKRKRHAERDQRARRGGVPLAAQADFDMPEEDFDPDAVTTKGKLEEARLDLLRKQGDRLERLEATARRDLIVKSDMLDALAAALQQLGKATRAANVASCRELNLPTTADRVFDRNMGQAQRDFVRALPDFLRSLVLPGEGEADA